MSAGGTAKRLRVFAGPPGGSQALMAMEESGLLVAPNCDFLGEDGDRYIVTDFTGLPDILERVTTAVDEGARVILRVVFIDSATEAAQLARDRGYETSLAQYGFVAFRNAVSRLVTLAHVARIDHSTPNLNNGAPSCACLIHRAPNPVIKYNMSQAYASTGIPKLMAELVMKNGYQEVRTPPNYA